MKMKKVLLLAAPLAVVFVTTWIVAAVETQQTTAEPMNSVVVQPVAPVVVTPSGNFDLEASPAVVETEASAASDVNADFLVPEITWYDPQALIEVSGIS